MTKAIFRGGSCSGLVRNMPARWKDLPYVAVNVSNVYGQRMPAEYYKVTRGDHPDSPMILVFDSDYLDRKGIK